MKIVDIFGDEREIEGKTCIECNEFKPLDKFGKVFKGQTSGVRNQCKICRGGHSMKSKYLRKFHKIPDDPSCEICKRKKEDFAHRYAKNQVFVLDHDHTSLKFRGYLCQDCNIGLGKFQDDPVRLVQGVIYLLRSGDYDFFLNTLNHLQKDNEVENQRICEGLRIGSDGRFL